MDEIKKLLSEEIISEIKHLASMEPGSQEHSDAVDSLAKLYKLNIEEIKLEQDYTEKLVRFDLDAKQHETDANLKEKQFYHEQEVYDRDEAFKCKQLCEQKKDRYFKAGLEAAGIILPLMFYATWMKRGLKFEETGTFTSTTFRGLFNRFRPTK